jgi:cysteinyl-tRNA synthetase, unknown class
MQKRAVLVCADTMANRIWIWTLFLAQPLWGAGSALTNTNDWLYVLQPSGAATLSAIAASDFDLVVLDYSSDGLAAGEFSPTEIANLKATGKVVLAYLSIGEAEDYRFYWDPTWNDQPAPDPNAPSWLGPFNPLFPNNYKVRYWQSGWRNILFGTTTGPSKSYLDRIIDQGFDGVYLDIIDAFSFWADEAEVSRAQARADMIQLMSDLATYARVTRNRPNFCFFPQNGLDVVLNDLGQLDAAGQSYLATIDGAGVEDLFYNELVSQDPQDTAFRIALLDSYRAAGGTILLVDYVWDGSAPNGTANVDRYNDFHQQGRSRNYLTYAALVDRDLDEILPVALGNGFNHEQPRADTFQIFADGFESGTTAAWSLTVP